MVETQKIVLDKNEKVAWIGKKKLNITVTLQQPLVGHTMHNG